MSDKPGSETNWKLFGIASLILSPLAWGSIATWLADAKMNDRFPDLEMAAHDWIMGHIQDAIESLGFDLNLSAEIFAWAPRINAIVPLEESTFYLFSYVMASATILLVKWVRNLTPFVS